MTRDTAASVFALATPLILALLGALFGALTRTVSRAARARGYELDLSVLGRGAVGVAADFAQHVVADLKDPTKHGTWDAVAARAVRDDAVARLARLYPAQFESVVGQIGAIAARELLGTLIEHAVVLLKTPPRAHAVGDLFGETVLPPSAPAPVPLTISPSALIPPGAIAQRGHIRAALLGVVLLVSLAGFTLRCIHAPTLPPVSGCTPGATACERDAKMVCSSTRRWEPAGDEPCAAQGRVCAMTDAGARCVRVTVTTDGGTTDATDQ